jgi:hypothetical protein
MAGIFHRISQHFQEAADHREQLQASRQAYISALNALAEPGADVRKIVASLPPTNGIAPADLKTLDADTFRKLAAGMLHDDSLTQDEETTLMSAATALGIDPARFSTDFPGLFDKLLVARVNDGRLPTLDSCGIILKKGEVAHMEVTAHLLKWQTVREWQGSSSGFSFRVAKGVRYHTGGTRGHLVSKGQTLVPDDTGTLTVTSLRAVYSGSKRALEFAYPKLLDVQVYSDGVRLSVSNRQQPSTFTLVTPDAVAAVINAAAQKLM